MSDVMSAPGLSFKYDRTADVLYVIKRPGVHARTREEDPGLLWRYDRQGGDLVGLTVLDFSTYWRLRRQDLIDQLAQRFGLQRAAAKTLLDNAQESARDTADGRA